jgi:hypothetical protein
MGVTPIFNLLKKMAKSYGIVFHCINLLVVTLTVPLPLLNQKAQNSEWTNTRLFYSTLLISLIHTRAEEGGFGAADEKRKKTKQSKDSGQKAVHGVEIASRNHACMILDTRYAWSMKRSTWV